MREAWRRQPEGAVEQNLPRRGRHQIVAANDLGDPLGGIIDDDRELIRWRSRRFPDDEVAADVVQVQRGRAAKAVVISDRLLADASVVRQE